MSFKNMFNKKKKQADKSPLNLSSSESNALKAIETVNRCAADGLIFLIPKEKQVMITADLALFFMNTDKRWNDFLNTIKMWFLYNKSQEEWNKVFIEAENKALREARKKYSSLSKADIVKIKTEARAAVDVEKAPVPEIDSFTFAITSPLSHEENPQIIVVGKYEAGEFTMVPYYELIQNIGNSTDKQDAMPS